MFDPVAGRPQAGVSLSLYPGAPEVGTCLSRPTVPWAPTFPRGRAAGSKRAAEAAARRAHARVRRFGAANGLNRFGY